MTPQRRRVSTLNFALPEDMKAWVKVQIMAGGYVSASHYIRTLLERDRQQVAMLDLLRQVLHYDDVTLPPTRACLVKLARRSDVDAWEAVFARIIALKRQTPME